MRYVKLGSTRLDLSRIGLDTARRVLDHTSQWRRRDEHGLS